MEGRDRICPVDNAGPLFFLNKIASGHVFPKTQRRYLPMVNSLKRAALCARVSTGEDRQDPETQLREAARRREIDVVLVWRYDRFARSTRALVNALKEFEALGVDFISCQEQIDTDHAAGGNGLRHYRAPPSPDGLTFPKRRSESASLLSRVGVGGGGRWLMPLSKVLPCARGCRSVGAGVVSGRRPKASSGPSATLGCVCQPSVRPSSRKDRYPARSPSFCPASSAEPPRCRALEPESTFRRAAPTISRSGPLYLRSSGPQRLRPGGNGAQPDQPFRRGGPQRA